VSRGGEITRPFGLEERLFRLGIGDWKKIQEEIDAGPFELFGRLGAAMRAMAQGLASIEGLMLAATCKLGPADARLVCYHGLIGGGMPANDAGRLVREVIGDLPGAQIDTAHAVVLASLLGAKDEPPGEPAGVVAKAKVATRRRPSRTASSGSRGSTPRAS
jgi:hypothetical protein